MSWAKLDDRFHGNRKVRAAWHGSPRALAMYVMSITYSAQHETDGLVDDVFIAEQLPVAKERQAVIDTLVMAGLWVSTDDGYHVHDYLDYHLSADVLAGKRAKDAARRAKGRNGNG